MSAGPATVDAAFWRGKRVLLTGHTGFKGSWLAIWLRRLGASVTAVALPPATRPSLFELAGVERLVDSRFCDILDLDALQAVASTVRPEIVLHLAAQAIVRAGYREPAATFATNVQGTVNVLEAVRRIDSVRVVVAITTDKVYRNDGNLYPYRETDPLGGFDPYSASKAAAEIVIASYRDAFLAERGVAVASARAGNVIGGGDWAEDRLIPDAVRAWGSGEPLRVRKAEAVRPWQHVLEPLRGYLVLAQGLWRDHGLAGAYNFGPVTHEAATVREVVTFARAAFGRGHVEWGDPELGPPEASWLALDVSKARAVLGVRPTWPLREAVRRTMEWYRRQADGESAIALCEADLESFEESLAT